MTSDFTETLRLLMKTGFEKTIILSGVLMLLFGTLIGIWMFQNWKKRNDTDGAE